MRNRPHSYMLGMELLDEKPNIIERKRNKGARPELETKMSCLN